MELRSPKFRNGNPIPPQYTCDGIDINPPLTITGIPEGTRSLALIVDDPDAPMGTWVHWVVWNIPPDIEMIKEDFVMEGIVEGVTSFGKSGWGGPCPPGGTHRYYFRLFALDTMLDLPGTASRSQLEKAMGDHIIKQTELFGTYTREVAI